METRAKEIRTTLEEAAKPKPPITLIGRSPAPRRFHPVVEAPE